jgi:hypothetical protein
LFNLDGKLESINQLLDMNGTPLSILEECYQAVISAALFYSKINKTTKDDQELNDGEKNQLVSLKGFYF